MREKSFANEKKNISSYVEEILQVTHDENLNLVLSIAQKHGTPPLQVTPIDGRHLEVLAKTVNPSKIVEIGTLCGYSAVCLSRALTTDGILYTCEKSPHHISVATEVFRTLNLQDKIKILEGEALLSLKNLEKKGPFDIVFIDANKEQYPEYFDWAIENLRQGGLLIADNVFVFGFINESNILNDKLQTIVNQMKEFNKKCVDDIRLICTFLPTGEGMLVAVKK